MAGSRPPHILVIRAPNGDVREVELADVVVVGRDESADVRVEDKKVSRRHAAFKLLDGKPFVEDLGSSNGVKLDGVRIEKRSRIDHSSEIRVGAYVVTLKAEGADDAAASGAHEPGSMPSLIAGTGPMARSLLRSGSEPRADGTVALFGLEPPVAGQRFLLGRGENVVGRLEECDVSVLHASVSRQHARLVVDQEGGVAIHDLNSANGVFVEGRRAEIADLAHGDIVRIGEVPFRVEAPSNPASARALDERVRSTSVGGSRGGRRSLFALGGLAAAAAALVATVIGLRGAEVEAMAHRWATRLGWSDVESVESGREATKTANVGGSTARDRGSAPRAFTSVSATTAPVAAPSPPAPPPGRPFGPVVTATAPWTPRGPGGLPVELPSVDPSFDHAGFVASALGRARAALERGDRDVARSELEALLEVDPVHGEARSLLTRVAELAAADEALAGADAFVAGGQLADAYRILSSVPLDLPQAEAARARAADLRDRAVEDALARAQTKARRRTTWIEAHELYKLALELDGDNPTALEGLRAVERNMRRRKLPFERWRPSKPSVTTADPATSPGTKTEKGRALEAVLEAYIRGDTKKARRLALARRRRARGDERARLDQILAGMKDVRRRFTRTRTEIANDPSQAWAMLIELEGIEREFVPGGRRSYLAQELRADLSDAFAKQGEALFDTQRFELAFQRWEAGYKLDPSNARVVAGLAKLESVATKLAEEARVAARRGSKGEACDRFRAVTRLTRSTHEAHREARKQAFRVCP